MHANYRSYGAAIKTASPGEIIDCIRSIDGATRQPTAGCTTRNTTKIDRVFFLFVLFPFYSNYAEPQDSALAKLTPRRGDERPDVAVQLASAAN